MNITLNIIAVVLLATGLILNFVTRSYRTDKYKALPWHKKIFIMENVNEYYSSPGPIFYRLSGSLGSTGALLFLIALATR
jgi:hypothetical protein